MKTLYDMSLEGEYGKRVCQHLSNAIVELVLNILNEFDASKVAKHVQKKENLVRNITKYIDDNFTEDIKLSDISNKYYISESSLSHIFKKETGISPIQYIIHRRIGEAQTLLIDTKSPIKEIEEKLGFSSSCHFSALFKKYVGIAPKEYRSYFQNTNIEKEKVCNNI